MAGETREVTRRPRDTYSPELAWGFTMRRISQPGSTAKLAVLLVGEFLGWAIVGLGFVLFVASCGYGLGGSPGIVLAAPGIWLIVLCRKLRRRTEQLVRCSRCSSLVDKDCLFCPRCGQQMTVTDQKAA